MEQQTVDARTAITEQLAVTAHIYAHYPRHVEAIGALVAEHVLQATAARRAADISLEQLLRAIVRDPRMHDIKARLLAEYQPPPYTQPLRLAGEPETEGEPITVSVGVGALAIAAAAAAGALIGASIPL
jgi:hypothetical protein